MALRLISFPEFGSKKRFNSKLQHACLPRHQSMIINVQCIAGEQNIEPLTSCRAQIWDNGYIKSFKSAYTIDVHKIRAEQLKANVKKLMNDLVCPSAKFELIDAIERLGVGYHFEVEISSIIDNFFTNVNQLFLGNNLHITALQFRLLRQHGYNISEDVFKTFQDEMGSFKACLCEDVMGLLSLYEASHLGFEGENVLDEAKLFTTMHLKEYVNKNNAPTLAEKVAHSLEVPLHWRHLKLEARWYIDQYERDENMIPALVELAKLDYNIVQTTYQKELANVVTWWEDLGLQRLSFVRERMMINYIWSMGMAFEPQFGKLREVVAKLSILLTILDDIYDTRGSLEELELFTEAVQRWDVNAMELLPQYMKICYMALLNTNNLIGYEILKEKAYDITSHQKKAWVDLCKAYLKEAKWFHKGYMPTSKDYLDNAVYSIGVHMGLLNTYFLTENKITQEALQCIESLPDIVYCPAIMTRLADDSGIVSDEHKNRIQQIYMKEIGISDKAARELIRQQFSEIWKKMNKERLVYHPFSEPFITVAINLCRQAQCIIMFEDGNLNLDKLMSMVFEAIPLK